MGNIMRVDYVSSGPNESLYVPKTSRGRVLLNKV